MFLLVCTCTYLRRGDRRRKVWSIEVVEGLKPFSAPKLQSHAFSDGIAYNLIIKIFHI